MLPVSELTLLVEQRVCGVEILDLPCMASGNNSDLTSEDMAYIQRQGIAVNNNNNSSAQNIHVPRNNPLTQLEEGKFWIYEGIICPRRSKHLHNINSDFNNYTCEKVMKMTKLKLFLILFPVDYLKEILIPKTNTILKHPIDLG